jgi:Ala-tRNA(Pro) deacylase
MKLEPFLQQNGVLFQKDVHPTTYTSQALAEAEGVSGYLVAKPVIVKTKSGFAMCVLPAPKHLDLKRVGDVLHDADVRLATEAEMAKLFPDCELGAEPPVGTMFGMKTIMDESLKAGETLVMQAGSHNEAVRLKRRDWERISKPETASIALQ